MRGEGPGTAKAETYSLESTLLLHSQDESEKYDA
jgi:hypothetical protein